MPPNAVTPDAARADTAVAISGLTCPLRSAAAGFGPADDGEAHKPERPEDRRSDPPPRVVPQRLPGDQIRQRPRHGDEPDRRKAGPVAALMEPRAGHRH